MVALLIVEDEKMIRRENWLLTEKYLKEGIREDSPRISDVSVERCEFNLRHLLIWADDQSFSNAFEKNSPPFAAYVANLPSRRGEGNLAAESQKKIINDSKRFLTWMNEEVSAKSDKVATKSIKRLVPPVVTNSPDPISVSLDEMLKIASINYGDNLLAKRDLAAMCFAYISGARADAIKSAPIKAINLSEMRFYQYPEFGVRTKYGKKAVTFLYRIKELVDVVKKWDDFVRENLPADALWYSPLSSHWGDYQLKYVTPFDNSDIDIGGRFQSIYEENGMGELFKSPHKFRHGNAVYGISRCKNMGEYQSLSRNLMHSSVVVTDKYYSVLPVEEREKIISKFVPSYSPVIESDLVEYLYAICRDNRMEAIQILAESMK